MNARDGVTPEMAKATLRRSNTTIAAMTVHLGDADGMLCDLVGRFDGHFDHIREVIGLREGAKVFAAVNALMLDKHTLFIADTFVNDDPDAEQLAEIAVMAVAEVRRFGLPPKVAFLSHSMFGSSQRGASSHAHHAECSDEGRQPPPRHQHAIQQPASQTSRRSDQQGGRQRPATEQGCGHSHA